MEISWERVVQWLQHPTFLSGDVVGLLAIASLIVIAVRVLVSAKPMRGVAGALFAVGALELAFGFETVGIYGGNPYFQIGTGTFLRMVGGLLLLVSTVRIADFKSRGASGSPRPPRERGAVARAP